MIAAAVTATALALTAPAAPPAAGAPFATITIPAIGLHALVREGVSQRVLDRGPGHYPDTALPGQRRTVAIAGHRTTYGAPFNQIDKIEIGDTIVLEMPYGTFTYVVYGHRIVDDRDWSIIRRRPWEKLVLSACHPLYSASHRYVVFARLV